MAENNENINENVIDATIVDDSKHINDNSEIKKPTRWCRFDTFSLIGFVLGVSGVEILVPLAVYILISFFVGFTAIVCIELASIGLVFSIVGMVFSIIAFNDSYSSRLRKLKKVGFIIGIFVTAGNAVALFLSIIILVLTIISGVIIPELNNSTSSLINLFLSTRL